MKCIFIGKTNTVKDICFHGEFSFKPTDSVKNEYCNTDNYEKCMRYANLLDYVYAKSGNE